jgi:hypothetical protein
MGFKGEYLREKPPPQKRDEFDQTHFDQQVARWERISSLPHALLIEDSPWAYYSRHSTHMPAQQRATCQAKLTTLTLPHLTLVLRTSGIEVGRRHPLLHQCPEQHSPRALD